MYIYVYIYSFIYRTAQRVIPNSGLRTAWSVTGQRKYIVIINSARPGRSLADGSALL